MRCRHPLHFFLAPGFLQYAHTLTFGYINWRGKKALGVGSEEAFERASTPSDGSDGGRWLQTEMAAAAHQCTQDRNATSDFVLLQVVAPIGRGLAEKRVRHPPVGFGSPAMMVAASNSPAPCFCLRASRHETLSDDLKSWRLGRKTSPWQPPSPRLARCGTNGLSATSLFSSKQCTGTCIRQARRIRFSEPHLLFNMLAH